jgi:hypothetical protein
VNARTVIMLVAAILWLTITGLTLYVLIKEGPDVLIFVSLVVLATLGMGIFGALNERRGGPR